MPGLIAEGRSQQPSAPEPYKHEAAEHRRILFERGSGVSPTWKSFRTFLSDLGPAPSDAHIATRLMAGDLTYGPGRVAWVHRSYQRTPVDPLAGLAPATGEAFGQWATVRGTVIGYSELAQVLGVPFEAMAVALRNQVTPDQLVQQASIAETLSQAPSPWLGPERREAFMTGYRMWHMQIQPTHAAKATPSFLFIYSALPSMLKLKQQLTEIGLWDPPTARGKEQRRDHDLWRRYCEQMARIESARADCPPLLQYSLATQVQEMWEHVKTLEQRFRTSVR